MCLQSVLARGLHALLPPIEVIRGSYCNANPENRREWEVRHSYTFGKHRRLPCTLPAYLQPAQLSPGPGPCHLLLGLGFLRSSS